MIADKYNREGQNMSEERFSLSNPINHNPIPNWVMIVHDDAEHKHMNAEEIVDLLNTLHQENQKLKEQNRKLYKLALNCKTIGDSDE